MRQHSESAVNFLKLVVTGRIDEAYEIYISPDMRHHTPGFAGDAAGLQNGMKENHEKYPDKVLSVQRVITELDLVAVHSHIQMDSADTGIAVVHLFRFNQRGSLPDPGQCGCVDLLYSPHSRKHPIVQRRFWHWKAIGPFD